ncbi:hypothetical protein FACS1894152_1820 [Bacilli bacterium]|nr:hypothetical protein FACS1894152_1820 [Bacilli bacterium]
MSEEDSQRQSGYELEAENEFERNWREGQFDEEGVFVLANGDRYEGELDSNNQATGSGVYIFANGDRYEGSFKEGRENKKGTLICSSGSKYEGEWKDGAPDGQGTMIYPNGNIYEGEWWHGKREEKGKLTTEEGVLEGYWDSDELQTIESFTKQIENNKVKIMYARNEPTGMAEVTFPNGSVYYGGFVDDRMEKFGVIKLTNGDEYMGEWSNNRLNTCTGIDYSDGNKRRGSCVPEGSWVPKELENLVATREVTKEKEKDKQPATKSGLPTNNL